MKTTRKFLAILMVITMILSLGAFGVFAQDVTPTTPSEDNASITISNASKGITYSVVKLFDANVTGNADGGSIFYTLPAGMNALPTSLQAYFEVKTTIGEGDAEQTVAPYVVAKETSLSTDAVNAMKDWAEEQTPTATAVSDGTQLTFTGLEYGYYVVLTSQGAGNVSVTSTNPTATIIDKNSTEPGVTKLVNDKDSYAANIGETVTYTATFNTANFLTEEDDDGDPVEGAEPQKVVKYEITDTLPAGVTLEKVESITVGGTPITTQQFNDGKITIDWFDATTGKHLYNNGAAIVVTYTATVNSDAVIDGTGNVNTITLMPYVADGPDDDDDPDPWDETWDDTATVYTYAAALKKVDENGEPLAGATFAANGLTVDGSNGKYVVTAYDKNSTDQGTTMSTDDKGNLVILGLSTDESLTVYEVDAPAGYNKLTAPITLKATKINETVTVTTTTIYYNEDGEATTEETETSTTTIKYNDKLEEAVVKVVNKKGTELPSTGGMGTALLIGAGSVLALAAAIFLVTKKRVSNAQY